MPLAQTITRRTGRDLVLESIIDAPPDEVFRAWTEPALMQQWFAPLPWTTPRVETDVRPGGATLIVMRSPEGDEFPSRGVYLEVVTDRRLVFTDAYTAAWDPSDKPFFTGALTFDALAGGKTRYVARARHWSDGDCEAHEKMGFHHGWAQCTGQLAALVVKV
jgi:uncharacterized protein YndB with AHSA1/START domain